MYLGQATRRDTNGTIPGRKVRSDAAVGEWRGGCPRQSHVACRALRCERGRTEGHRGFNFKQTLRESIDQRLLSVSARIS
jgi:hypothetical protein